MNLMNPAGDGSTGALDPADASELSADSVPQEGCAAPAVRPTHRKTGWLTAGAVIVVLILLVGASWTGRVLYEEHCRSVAATEALQAAQRYVSLLINMNAGKLVGKSDEILNGSTGDFHEKFGKADGKLRALLESHDVVARGEVVEAAVKTATPTRVVVLMFIDQSLSTRTSPEPTIERSRIMMVMTKVNGQWLASRVSLI